MRFMNEYEIEDQALRHAQHPVLGPATRTLQSLVTWTNRNSDGWPYWPKPARSAAKLMDLIEGERDSYFDRERADATPAKLKAALSPVKAFRTRQNAHFEIFEA